MTKSRHSILPIVGAAGIVAAVLLGGAVSTASAAGSLIGLGFLPGTSSPPGASSSAASGVSADGSVIVGLSGISPPFIGGGAFRWTSAGGMVGLGVLPGGANASAAYAVSGDGATVVGTSHSDSYYQAFRWTSAGGLVALGFLPDATFQSRASGVSADGSVVVGTSSSSVFTHQAFRWTAGAGMSGLGFLPGDNSSFAGGVSADGSVVAGTSYFSYPHGAKAFRWTSDAGMQDLGFLPGASNIYGNAVSADGSTIVGGAQMLGFHQAFRWTSAGGMVGLGFLPGVTNDSSAKAVSGDGSVIVGGPSVYDFGGEAFLWTEAVGIQRLWDVLVARGVDPAASGWTTLRDAKGISLDGNTIVGWGERNGSNEAFVAVLNAIPEPSSLGLLLPLAAAALLRRRRGPGRRGKRLHPTLPGRYELMRPSSLFGALVGSLLVTAVSQAVTIDTVPIGNPGNPADMHPDGSIARSGVGSVGYSFRMGKYEVTNAQYVEFLNGVDPTGTNTLELYNNSMSSDGNGGILQNLAAATGSKYSVKPGRDNNPVALVSWFDAIRFANWLHNGQGGGGTENGAYTLLGGTPTPSNGDSITRNPGARWWLPSEDEWYKAAYHNNDGASANYWNFPTASDSAPTAEPPSGGANSANYGPAGIVTLTDVGAYINSPSPYGTFDQGGNVSEWNEWQVVVNPTVRGIRGGSWNDGFSYLSAENPIPFNVASTEISSYGFRVATIPEPSAPCLGSMAVIGMCRRRRHTS